MNTDGTLLSSWLIHHAKAHHTWDWWYFAITDISKVKPATDVKYPDAEYELIIAALEPGSVPEESFDPDHEDFTLRPMVPLDVCLQFFGVGPETVKEIGEGAVRTIVNGLLSPEEDWTQAWMISLRATLNHYGETNGAE